MRCYEIKKKSVFAIVVTYKPQVRDLVKNISHYIDAVQQVIIVDNGNCKFDNVFFSQKKIHIIRTLSNLGIAKAQNLGIAFSRKTSQDGLCIFFDQDSYITFKDLNKLVTDYYDCNWNNIGIFAPGEKAQSQKVIGVSEVISSGSLIPLNIFKKIGMFREELFIDFVDYEFCWRLKNNGYIVCVDSNVQLIHQTGKNETKVGKVVSAPFRNYYVFRNIIYLAQLEYGSMPFRIRWLYRMFKRTIFELIFCGQKGKRSFYILKGIKDGATRKMGPLN